MSALAKILKCMGKDVRGYDRVRSEYTDRLTAAGIQVDFGGDCGAIDGCDVFVYTDAIKGGDARIAHAVETNKLILSRGRLLAELSGLFGRTIAVAGCHGKTTCTSMLAHIFCCAGKNFTAHIGGNDRAFGNAVFNGCDYFITEACEYNKNFLLLDPDVGIILNCDADHLECYGGYGELIESYGKFAQSSAKSVVLSGDAVRGDVTFGIGSGCDYSAVNIISRGGRYSFEISERGTGICRVGLKVYGRHNVLNALAAAAAARSCGIRPDAVEDGLNRYPGTERRFESLGRVNGAEVIADYAHHPREIAALLRTAREITKGEIYIIFQPHTYSRTKNFFDEFVSVLSGVSNLLIYKTFAAREYFDECGSAFTLSCAIKNSRYAESEREILGFLSRAGSGDKVFVLGAGDIYFIVKKLMGEL